MTGVQRANTHGSARGRRAAAAALGVMAVLGLSACGGGGDAPAASGSAATAASSAAAASTGGGTTEPLMENKQLTTLDQPIKYPTKGAAEVSSSLLTLEPGQESGWHKDRVPLFVYVLEGTLSVEYDAGVTKEYPAGTSYMEAQGVWHNASNKTNDAVKLLRVYMGAKGVKSTVERSS